MKKETWPIYMSDEKLKNVFWAVYNKKGKIISISEDKTTAQKEALASSNYRWTYQTFKQDWGYLIEDGYTVEKSAIIALQELEEKINDAVKSAYNE